VDRAEVLELELIMVPRTILTQLARLRRRERTLGVTWGLARFLALVLVVLAAACLSDWLIDRREDTPWNVRVALLIGQAVLWFSAGLILVARPLFRRLGRNRLALFVEQKIPSLEHRLISTVQLHEPNADTRGMSPELIDTVAREAATHLASLRLARLADHRRLKWSAGLIVPFAAAVAVVILLWPDVISALLARQFLANREIPRSVQLTCIDSQRIEPSGTGLVLRFRAHGHVSRDMQGEAQLDPDGERSVRYPLVFESMAGPNDAVFAVNVPPSAVDFSSLAWLADGRTHESTRVHFEARPAVVEQRAWMVLPDYVGHRPDGQPYEQEQPRGDITGLPHSKARVQIRAQKPIVQATVELLGPRTRRVPMRLTKSDRAECTFALRPEETAYRVLVRDRYGFTNADPARRGIRIIAEELPRVALLPERFPGMSDDNSAEDTDVDGVPVPLGGSIRIGYWCAATYGLGKARLRYRVNDGPWTPLPLRAAVANGDSGPFDPQRGAFRNSGPRDQVEFYAEPSPDPTRTWAGTEGGGRFDFQTRSLPGLKVGDRIEFYVEAFDRDPDPEREPGRSESRVKTVVTLPELEQWVQQMMQEESRIRGLERKQHGVFAETDTSESDDTSINAGEPTEDVSAPAPSVTQKAATSTTFLRSWQLLGPLPNHNDQGHEAVYAPETDPVDLQKPYAGIHGEVRWKAYDSNTDKIDLEKFFHHSDAGVAYAVCWVHSDRKRVALLATGSDDGIKVWLNRKLALDRRVHREAVPGDDKQKVELSPGWNEVLVKVDNAFGSWAFYLELRDPTNGGPLDGIRVANTPQAPDYSRFARHWELLGPFPNAGGRGHDIALPPETEPFDLLKRFDGIPGKIGWRRYHGTTGRVDLAKFFARPFDEANVGYAACWVHSATARPITLATGSHDGIKVWLNQKQILDKKIAREASPAQEITPARLRAGWNDLLVKVDNHGGRWAFYLELRDPAGAPLQGLQYVVYPPLEYMAQHSQPAQGAGRSERFLRTWQLLGPFASKDDRGHHTAYPPEKEPLKLEKAYQGAHGPIRWRWHQSRTDYVDLAKTLHYRDKGVAYAVCWVYSDHRQPVELSIGSDDGIKIWIKNHLVFAHDIARSAAAGQDHARTDLLAGWNKILLKIDNRGDEWGFYLELRNPTTHAPLAGLRYRATPPGGKSD
jgi:hypothetical protein